MLLIELSKEEREKMKTALVEFVVRVSSAEEQSTEAEIAALPRIASLLLDSNG